MTGDGQTLVLGLDGGGSKTLLAVADRRGRVSALHREAGVNPFDAPEWREVLARLKTRINLIAPAVAHAAFGLPGYGETAAVTAAQNAAAEAFGLRSWSALNDVEAAFEAAFVGCPGVLLLAGTGSMAWGRSPDGRDFRTGGWGEAFGDEGSAFWIGRSLLGEVSRALDGRLVGQDRGAALAMSDALFRRLGLNGRDPQDALMGWYVAQGHPRSAIASLAGLVDAEARAGNAAALELLAAAADHLALHVEAAWNIIAGPAERSAPREPWSYAGGAFNSRLLLDRVVARLGSEPVEPALPPVGGALLRAARQAGWDTGGNWLANLQASLADHLQRPDRFE